MNKLEKNLGDKCIWRSEVAEKKNSTTFPQKEQKCNNCDGYNFKCKDHLSKSRLEIFPHEECYNKHTIRQRGGVVYDEAPKCLKCVGYQKGCKGYLPKGKILKNLSHEAYGNGKIKK